MKRVEQDRGGCRQWERRFRRLIGWAGTACWVLVGLLSGVHADTGDPMGGGERAPRIGLPEMYRSALATNERLRIAQEGFVRSEEEVARSRSFFLPRLDVGADYLRRPKTLFGSSNTFVLRPEEEIEFSVVLSQPLFTGWKNLGNYRAAKRGREVSRQLFETAKDDLLFDVAQAYYVALIAQKNVVIEEEEVKRLEAHRRDADKRLQVGEVTKTVLLRAEAELSGAKASLIQAKNDFENAKHQLSILTGVPLDFALQDPPLLDHPRQTEEALLQEAMRRRPDLIGRRLDEEISRDQVTVARGSFWPSLTLEGRFNWIDNDPAGSFLIRRDRMALLRLDFPLFEGGIRRAELSQARSRVRESGFNLSLLLDEISLQIRKDILDLAAFTAVLENLKDRVAFARENFTMVSRQFAVGLATNIDLLDANATLNDAERQHVNAVYNRELAILRLNRDRGGFADRILSAP